MLIWMRHKEHGIIDVYDDGTVEFNKKQGWEVFDREAEKGKKPEARKETVSVAPAPETVDDWLNGEAPAPAKRPPGRPRKDA